MKDWKAEQEHHLATIWSRQAKKDYQAFQGTFSQMFDEIDGLGIYVGKKNRIKSLALAGTAQLLKACIYLCSVGGVEMARKILKEVEEGI